MKMEITSAEICRLMRKDGFPAAVFSADRLQELRVNFLKPVKDGVMDPAFYDEIVGRYDLMWEFDPPTDKAPIKSIILVAGPQSKVRVVFQHAGSSFGVILPPTYPHDTDLQVVEKLSAYLLQSGYRAEHAILPEKLLAVRSSLARYGKNNISYIEGLGSFFRPRVFFSDLPCDSDDWQEVRMMDHCNECNACVRHCPTGAIAENRFLIHGERCLTYFNEGEACFPDWIETSWHNSLIGCMVCQDVCPANKDCREWIIEGECFSEEETVLILEGVPREQIPSQTAIKLKKLNLLEHYGLLKRNLRAVIPS